MARMRKAERLPAIERLRHVFNYEPQTGRLTWKAPGQLRWRCNVGKDAGCPDKRGYLRVRVDGITLAVHRIVWAHFYGEWPSLHIDHINNDKADNRIVNLRHATISQNKANSKPYKNNGAGLKGAYRGNGEKRWTSVIRKDGKLFYLGKFDTPEEAHQEYCRHAALLHGEFARAS